MRVGTEWLVDAEGCDAAALRDLALLRALLDGLIADLCLTVVGEGSWHRFPGAGGVTGMYLLTESHLACHTYPESGTATFNLHCCRPRSPWPWDDRLRIILGAARVTVRVVERGGDAP